MCLLSSSLPSISYGDRSLYRDEDLEEVEEDEDEDEEEEEEEDEDDDEDDEDDDNDAGSLSGDNCSLSSGDDGIFGQRRKTLRSSKRKVNTTNVLCRVSKYKSRYKRCLFVRCPSLIWNTVRKIPLFKFLT